MVFTCALKVPMDKEVFAKWFRRAHMPALKEKKSDKGKGKREQTPA